MYVTQSVTKETPVTIVGGSLSGLVLSKELSSLGIDHLVLEASPQGKSPSIHYLTSRAAARSLGIEGEYNEAVQVREPITGYVRYDGNNPRLEPLEELLPKAESRDGFVTFSLEEIRQMLASDSLNVLWRRSASYLERDGSKWRVYTTSGEVFQTQIVIDATGSRAIVLSRLYGNGLEDIVKNRFVRTCFGGVFPYEGPENILMTVDNFPTVGEDIPKEGAGGIIPLGRGFAYVLVGWETNLREVNSWYSSRLEYLIQSYVDWFNSRGRDCGIKINFDRRREIVAGSYSQGLLDYRHVPIKQGIAAFGEALGLNQPLHGYLIKDIAFYAKVMAQEIGKYLDGSGWDPHRVLVATSPIIFGLQVALSRWKTQNVLSEEGRSKATRRLQNFLIDILGEDGLWYAIDNGVPTKKVLSGLIYHPQYLDVVLGLGLDYLKVLFKEPLYLEELGLKVQNRVLPRHRNGP